MWVSFPPPLPGLWLKMLSKRTKNADPLNTDNSQQHTQHVRAERLPVPTPGAWELRKTENQSSGVLRNPKNKIGSHSWNALARKALNEKNSSFHFPPNFSLVGLQGVDELDPGK